MEIAALLVVQLVATAAVFAALWRKLDRINADLARVKRMLETLEMVRFSAAAQKRPQPARAEAALAPAATTPPTTTPSDDPFDASWVRPGARVPRGDSFGPALAPSPAPRARRFMANEAAEEVSPWRVSISPETARLISAAAMALAPLTGLGFGVPAQALVATGLSVGAALMLLSLQHLWRAAAWVGAFASGAWALTAFATDAAQSAPMGFPFLAAVAGAAGLGHARLRGAPPGAVMALFMGATLLALSNAAGMIGPAGAAFAVFVALVALLGASSQRVEGFHLAAFAAAIGGLYVLSGQGDAAVWFTPVAAWTGALFFGVAFVRVPALGARGVVLAATGIAAPILAAGMLSLSQHGLADPRAAAGVFTALALLFGALLALAARQSPRGIGGLNLTAWVLMIGAVISLTLATLLAVPAPLAASVLASAALGLVLLDRRAPQLLWRASAVGALVIAAIIAWGAVAQAWPSLLTLAAALATPTLAAGGAALLAQPRTPRAAAIFEAGAIVGALASSVALLRFLLSGGAPNAMPIGFLEAGVQIAAIAALSLTLAVRAERGAVWVSRAAASLLGFAALGLSVVAGLLWLTPFWAGRLASGVDLALFQHAPLGFAPPAIAAWAHWVFWRGRNAHLRTRAALAIAALLSAAFVSVEVLAARGAAAPGQADWTAVVALALSFAMAIAVNFVPGMTSGAGPHLDFQKYFERNRRRQQRR